MSVEDMEVMDEQIVEETQTDVQEEDSTAGQEPIVDTRADELDVLRKELESLKDGYSRSQQEIEYLRNVTLQPQAPVDEGDPDDFIVRNEAKKMIQREMESTRQQLRRQELSMLEAQTMAKYPDYNDVVNKYGKAILDATPGLLDAILSSPNPAEVIYHMSKGHPEYYKQVQTKARQDTVKKIQGNLSTTPTVASQGGSISAKAKDWNSASDADIEAKLVALGINN